MNGTIWLWKEHENHSSQKSGGSPSVGWDEIILLRMSWMKRSENGAHVFAAALFRYCALCLRKESISISVLKSWCEALRVTNRCSSSSCELLWISSVDAWGQKLRRKRKNSALENPGR
jgi:hypothetical protein